MGNRYQWQRNCCGCDMRLPQRCLGLPQWPGLDRQLAPTGWSPFCFKYYASLAKLMHIWRDNSRQVFLYWIARFGAVEAARHAKRMPPCCNSGRWGSISIVENLLLDACQDQVQSVFLQALDIASAPPGQPGVLRWRMVHRLQPWRTRVQAIQSLRNNKWLPC